LSSVYIVQQAEAETYKPNENKDLTADLSGKDNL
jgi:hypothetical protein